MKKYFIVGLGMIGASYAKRLKQLNYKVYGYDICEETNKKAVSLGYIDDYGLNHIKDSDLVILTLYPNLNITFIEENICYFKNVKIVTDVSGIKTGISNKLNQILPKNTKYLSHHPMAGSEKSGIDAANEKVFYDANFLIVYEDDVDEEALDTLMQLKKDLNFGKTSIINAHLHDVLISFTSQLPHMIAVGLVNSDTYVETKDFAGDSYKDLTRIANINEKLWTELFCGNKESLLHQMEKFKLEFNKLYKALKEDNKNDLEKLLKEAKVKRSGYNH